LFGYRVITLSSRGKGCSYVNNCVRNLRSRNCASRSYVGARKNRWL